MSVSAASSAFMAPTLAADAHSVALPPHAPSADQVTTLAVAPTGDTNTNSFAADLFSDFKQLFSVAPHLLVLAIAAVSMIGVLMCQGLPESGSFKTPELKSASEKVTRTKKWMDDTLDTMTDGKPVVSYVAETAYEKTKTVVSSTYHHVANALEKEVTDTKTKLETGAKRAAEDLKQKFEDAGEAADPEGDAVPPVPEGDIVV